MQQDELYNAIAYAANMLSQMDGRFIGLIGADKNGKTLLFIEMTIPPAELAKALEGLAKAANEYLKSLPVIKTPPADPQQN